MWFAAIPLLHQLLLAYHSQPLGYQPPTIQQQVLGAQTTQSSPATQTPRPEPIEEVGGEGQTLTIAVLGDSMIDTLGSDLVDLRNNLRQQLPNYHFNLLNYGYGASTLEYAHYRLNHDYNYLGQQYPSLLSQKPDIIIIESFAYNNYGNQQSGFDKQWMELGAITTDIRKSLPNTKIILAATIAPNSVIFANGAPGTNYTSLEKIEKSSTIKLYLQNLVNFANSQQFPLADAYHPSLSGSEGQNRYISTTDNLHPSTEGARLFSSILANTITSTLRP